MVTGTLLLAILLQCHILHHLSLTYLSKFINYTKKRRYVDIYTTIIMYVVFVSLVASHDGADWDGTEWLLLVKLKISKRASYDTMHTTV